MWNGFRFGMGMMAGLLTTCLLLSVAVFMFTLLWDKIESLLQTRGRKIRDQYANVVPFERRYEATLPCDHVCRAFGSDARSFELVATGQNINRKGKQIKPRR